MFRQEEVIMKMKRVLALGMAALLTAGLMAGCGSSGKKEAKGGDGDGEKITIRLLTRMAGTSKQVEVYQGIIDEFKAKHPEVEIQDDSQGDESAFNNILNTDIASGTMPNIFRIQGVANLAGYIDNGLIMDVEPFLKEDAEWGGGFTEGALSYYKVPGKEGVYGIPMESGLIGVYYNEELLKNAGVDKFPETWSQLLDAVKKIKDSGVTPIALGAGAPYMAGHLHDQIFYKWAGTEAAKKLGNRELKYTDPVVVETFGKIKELIDAGAFDPNAAGIMDDVAMADFQAGKAAMVITGPWMIGRFSSAEDTAVSDKIKVAKFPYFEEKPEFKDDDMQILSPYMVSGKLEGKELDLTMELVKMLTSKDAAKVYAEECAFLIPRTDIDLDESKCQPLFIDNMKLGGTSKGIGVDVFDFDPITSMQDVTRNNIVSIFTGETPEHAAEAIQSEIDNAQ